jgi:hypothetical protein
MVAPVITALPTAPNIADPNNFAADASVFVAALEPLRTEINSFGTYLNSGIEFTTPFASIDVNGGTIDGTVIGGTTASTGRFTDVTATGGIYVGGTGLANKLDDYEEGTWTPGYSASSVALSSVTYNTTFTKGTYTKVGDTVTVWGYIRTEAITVGSGAGTIRLFGLPFASSAGVNSTTDTRSRGACTGDAFGSNAPSTIQVQNSSTLIELSRLNSIGNATSHTLVVVADLATGTVANIITFTISYKT